MSVRGLLSSDCLAPRLIPSLLSRPTENSHRLQGSARQRFLDFFLNRTYLYRASFDMAWGPMSLEFDLPLIGFLKCCRDQLKKLGIPVHGVFLKGGAVQYLLSGDRLKLSDLDLTIQLGEVPGRGDFDRIETAFLESLQVFAGIYHFTAFNSQMPGSFTRTYMQGAKCLFSEVIYDKKEPLLQLFSIRGAVLNRKVVFEGETSFAIHTLPTCFQGCSQEIDIQFLDRAPHSCFCSRDAIQINISPLLDLEGEVSGNLQIPLQAVDGYDLSRSLELMERHLFDVEPRSNIKNIREGLRGYCRILSRGDLPMSRDIECLFWEQFIKEYKPNGFFVLFDRLDSYLQKHCLDDIQGKIVYLLNYYHIFQRCDKKTDFIDEDEKKRIEEVILDCLCRCLGEVKDGYTISEMRTVVEFTCCFLFFRAGSKRAFKQDDKEAFFVVERGRDEECGNNYLFCPWPEIEKDRDHSILSNKLLQKLVLQFPYSGSDLAEFFRQNRPRPQTKKLKMPAPVTPSACVVEEIKPPLSRVEKCLSEVGSFLAKDLIKEAAQEILSSGLKLMDFVGEEEKIDEWVREIGSKLIEKKQVDLSVKLTSWAIEKNILQESSRNAFLHSVLKGLCAQGCVKKASVIFRLMCSRKEAVAGFLSAFEPFDMDASDLSKLLESIGLAQKNGSWDVATAYNSWLLLFVSILNQQASLLPQAAHNVRAMPLEWQKNLFFDLIAQLPPKVIFSFFKALCTATPDAVVLAEPKVIECILPEFFRVDKSAALSFYLRQEVSLLKSDSYFAIYPIFARAVVSWKDERIDAPLLNGLVKLEETGSIAEILKIFNDHHEFFLKKKEIAKQLKKILSKREDEDFKALRKALGLIAVKVAVSQQAERPRAPKKTELSHELVDRLNLANGFVDRVIKKFFSLDSSVTEEKIKAMDEQIDLVHKHFISLEKSATNRQIHVLHIHVLLVCMMIKKEKFGDSAGSLELKNCLNVFKDAFERGFFDLDNLQDLMLWSRLAEYLTKDSEGFDSFFKLFASMEDRNKASFSNLVRVRIDILQKAIVCFSRSKDMLFMKIACQHLDALSSLLAKNISEASYRQWDKIFQFSGEIAGLFGDVGWNILCPNTPGAVIDRDLLNRGKKMLLASFDKVVRDSDLTNAYDLSFDMNYLKNLQSIAQTMEDKLGEGFFYELYKELRDRLKMCWISDQFLATASVEELREAFEKSNKLAISLVCLQAMSLKDPENEWPWMQIAELYVRLQAWDDAIRTYDIVSSKNPKNIAAFIGLGKVYQRQRKWNDAYAVYANLKDSSPESEPLFVQDLSICCLCLEMYKDAVTYAEKAAELHPDDPVVLAHRADCYSHLGNLSRAIVLIEEVCDRYPSYAHAFCLSGHLYVNEIKKLGQAGAFASEIVERWRKVKKVHGRYNDLVPNHFSTLLTYGAACFNLDEWDEAFIFLSRAYELNREDKACLVCLAECHSKRKEPELAIRKISMAILLEGDGNSEVCIVTRDLINLMVKRAYYCLEAPTTPERVAMAQQDMEQVKSTFSDLWASHVLLPVIEKKLSKYKK